MYEVKKSHGIRYEIAFDFKKISDDKKGLCYIGTVYRNDNLMRAWHGLFSDHPDFDHNKEFKLVMEHCEKTAEELVEAGKLLDSGSKWRKLFGLAEKLK
jgi:hypothetical protein